jgi:hypothetical protein
VLAGFECVFAGQLKSPHELLTTVSVRVKKLTSRERKKWWRFILKWCCSLKLKQRDVGSV